ncbi:unnamed protein product, partial [Polarella glacialis]
DAIFGAELEGRMAVLPEGLRQLVRDSIAGLMRECEDQRRKLNEKEQSRRRSGWLRLGAFGTALAALVAAAVLVAAPGGGGGGIFCAPELASFAPQNWQELLAARCTSMPGCEHWLQKLWPELFREAEAARIRKEEEAREVEAERQRRSKEAEDERRRLQAEAEAEAAFQRMLLLQDAETRKIAGLGVGALGTSLALLRRFR